MFCKKCGSQINDDAAFCSICGAPSNPIVNVGPTGGGSFGGATGGGSFAGVDPLTARKYLIRGAVGVAAIILAIISIVFLVQLVSTIEGVITSFSGYDALASGLGIAGFIVCGLLLTGCAFLATLPVSQFALGNNMGQISIDRSMAFSIVLLVLCIAVWICKLIFHSPIGSSASGVLYTIFSTFGGTATGCLVPVIIAIVILYIVRTKLVPGTGGLY